MTTTSPPAVELARELIAAGRLGVPSHVSVRFLADYAAHPDGALTWRFQNAAAGSGVLGDLVSHGIDLARYLVGEVTDLVRDRATFITERPRPSGAASHFSGARTVRWIRWRTRTTCQPCCASPAGARGILESSRASVGEPCTYGIEVHGDRSALAWDFRRMDELQLCLDQDYQNASYATRYVAPGDGDLGDFQPGSGIAMGYDDLKVIEAARLIRSISSGTPEGATIEDALRAAEFVAAMVASLEGRCWVAL